MNLRKITDSDRPQIDDSIALDPFHAGKGSAEFFFEPHTDAFEFDGLYVRLGRALRVNIVFKDSTAREQNKEAMTNLALFLKKLAGEQGYKEVIFTSTNPALRKFGETLGFEEQPTLVQTVEPPDERV